MNGQVIGFKNMKDLLLCEFYKLFKSKAVWVCTIVMAGIIALTLLLSMTAMDGMARLAESNEEVAVALPLFMFSGGNALEFAMSMCGDVLIIIVTVVICSMIVTEYQRGIMRNLVMSGKSRTEVYIAKYITALAYAFALYILTYAVYLVTFLISEGWGDVSAATVAGRFFLVMLQIAAFAAVVLLIAAMTKSTGATIGLSIALFFVFQIIASLAILPGIDENLAKVFEYAGEVYPGNLIVRSAANGLEGAKLLQYSLTGAAVAVCSLAGGILFFNRNDLK